MHTDICEYGPRMVDVLGTKIPAVNVQVDDAPRWVTHEAVGNLPEVSYYYPVYFETPFEDGALMDRDWETSVCIASP